VVNGALKIQAKRDKVNGQEKDSDLKDEWRKKYGNQSYKNILEEESAISDDAFFAGIHPAPSCLNLKHSARVTRYSERRLDEIAR
jgi:hypothetical protein